MLLTSLAWGLATSPSFASIVRLALSFVFIHFLVGSLIVSTAAFFLVGRLLGPGIAGLPGRRRQQGLFGQVGGAEQLEFGYCFDVSLQYMTLPSMPETWHPSSTKETNSVVGQGCNTSLFSCLGISVRRAVHLTTPSIQRLLVESHPPLNSTTMD